MRMKARRETQEEGTDSGFSRYLSCSMPVRSARGRTQASGTAESAVELRQHGFAFLPLSELALVVVDSLNFRMGPGILDAAFLP